MILRFNLTIKIHAERRRAVRREQTKGRLLAIGTLRSRRGAKGATPRDDILSIITLCLVFALYRV